MDLNGKIFVAGHRGLVGSAIVRQLQNAGYTNLITRTHTELDLTDQLAVADFFGKEKPDYVFLAAAKVGGIIANNTYRADFIYENLAIQNNVIHQSYLHGVKKLLFLGSTCIYPRECPQPMKEESLLTSPLEYTNEPYAIAKIAGIKLCESYNLQYGTNFISVMPTNLYGPGDNFDLEKSHVLPAMVRKMHLAKLMESGDLQAVVADLQVPNEDEALAILGKFGVSSTSVQIWGTGKPRREFLWSEDMAAACVYLMQERDFADTYAPGSKEVRNTHINIGTGEDVSIAELAELVRQTVGFGGELVFDASKPDGTLRKLTDVSKLHALGWRHQVDLGEGVQKLYSWYLNNDQMRRGV
ncbi:GDP-L-fucose synthase family protein [Syntrophotalea acetylenica]|uniref:GDP-L-fucose synthase n=1 Tax=Syntrophotalea acetylenica TaxID=29542 RepID=A0A1L3GID1_SYNAC|nr:GDP-L-fucose synthase [Syntrophotalea acetylenica]APG25683.1 GDP-fucose synthetase [Syntrophotalea acetylenica]APG43755.1 GDP-fucose synthetase [Syntrophotalea acetylenica]